MLRWFQVEIGGMKARWVRSEPERAFVYVPNSELAAREVAAAAAVSKPGDSDQNCTTGSQATAWSQFLAKTEPIKVRACSQLLCRLIQTLCSVMVVV